MATSLMQHMCCLIMLSVCIDQGDGRWRERDKENLRHDIELYRKLTEKIEHEIEVFYDEYPDKRLEVENSDGIHYEHLTNTLNRSTNSAKENDYPNSGKQNDSSNTTSEITSVMPSKLVIQENDSNKSNNRTSIQNKTDSVNDLNASNSDWPKFNDILLAIGKRYDWKTDRWIKVKQKSKVVESESIKTKENNTVIFHENHKFNYRIVKLNRSKSRRNVVVAVSAVR